MLISVLAQYIKASSEEIERLLSLSRKAIYADPTYQSWIKSLDRESLESHLPAARQAYDTHLEEFKAALSDSYDFTNTTMSSFTLANWMLGFLQFSHRLPELPDRHHRVPLAIMQQGLPKLLEYLEDMEEGGAEWQRAMAIVCLPLLVENQATNINLL